MIEWVATVSADVTNVATPPATAPVPMEVAPSKKVTVPVAAEGETLAVNITVCPKVDGFKLELNPVVVLVLAGVFTTCETADDVLAL